MYDRKLKAWGVQKNMSRAQKMRLVDYLVSTGTWINSTTPSSKGCGSMDARDHAKVMRFARSKRPTASPQGGHRPARVELVLQSESDESLSSCSSPSLVLSQQETGSFPQSPSLAGSLQDGSNFGSQPDHFTSSRSQRHSPTDLFEVSSFGDEEEEKTPLVTPDLLLCSLHFAVYGTSSLNLERVFGSIYAFLSPSSRALSSEQRRSTNGRRMLPNFWTELKHGIYLLKVQSPRLAWPAINKACDIAPRALRSADDFSADFLLELFSTLSPVNTRICPRLRTTILQYFGGLARMKLPSTHPVAVICHELQKDTGHHREVSEQALVCLRDASSVVSEQVEDSEIEFRSECSLITLRRRASELDAASERAQALVHRTRSQPPVPTAIGGADTLKGHRRLTQARSASAQLAHVYMDQSENLDEAVKLCLFRITGEADYTCRHWHTMPATMRLIHDSMSIHAMEDLAKIYGELCNDATKELVWLEQAAKMAPEILGNPDESVATQHILDKLRRCKEARCSG